MRQRQRQPRRPSTSLRTAAVLAAAVPVLALAPAVQASGDSADGHAQPDLVVSELPAVTLQPGEVRHDTVTVTNNGTAPADGFLFRIRLTRGLAFPGSDSGCTYSTASDQEHQALCRLDVTLQPGASTTVPVPIKVLSKALMEAVEYGTGATGADPGASGGGSAESYHQTLLKADNSADFVAVGDQAWAHPGRTVTLRASLRNAGPGWVRINDSDDQPALMVTVPPGTVAVRVPSDCQPFDIDGPSGPSQPGKPVYVCYPSDHTFEVGSVHSYTFQLKVNRGTPTTSGEAKVTSVYGIHPDFDHNAANDKAALTVSVHGHGHGHAQGSGSGASPTPTPEAKAGAAGTHSPAAAGSGRDQAGDHADTALAADSAADATPAGNGTGATPYVAAAGALTAAGLGGLAFLAVRRRRREGSS
ncbi:hypothetical protein [Streptomyces odontomachi]|uniref:hypothetical protein n=1 Tax=Streptomyces odontomachi TaxID=2944940 RepID=UPI00210A61F9|nr:hypothetical protein [Streptomyces sp. ODS25]